MSYFQVITTWTTDTDTDTLITAQVLVTIKIKGHQYRRFAGCCELEMGHFYK